MPVKEAMVFAQQRQARSKMQTDGTVLLLSCIAAALAVMILVAVSGEFAEAMVLLGSY